MDYIDLLAYCMGQGVIPRKMYYTLLPRDGVRVCYWCKTEIRLVEHVCHPNSIKNNPEFGVIWNHEECQIAFLDKLERDRDDAGRER